MAEDWKKWEGQVVNEEFQLVRYLGGSDHSAVFLTKRADREPQDVAIKLILADAENPELQLSWWELSAKLSHPHLLRLFQRGRCQLDNTELLYAVTEYAEESLSQILPYRALTAAETQDMLQSVTDALAYVHAKGFVHGHIKPANIMAVGEQIKVSSDGLCGAGESSRVLRAPGVYTAPEIADGGGMTPASDVWSLGMTLVEALTQEPPSLQGQEQTEPVLPPTLPQPFLDIANHCLRRDPQHRSTVPDIAARLRQPSPPPLVKREQKIVEPAGTPRKRGYLGPAIAAGVLLLAIFGSRMLRHSPSAEPSSAAQSSTQPAEPPQKAEPSPAETTPAQTPPAQTATKKKHQSKAPVPAAANNSTGPRTSGAVAQQVSPDVSKSALRTIQGKVKIRVKLMVDSSGKVITAKFDSRGPSKYFADRSLEAAQQWTFNPPQVGGQGVPSEWMLKFEFTRSGASVHPTQTAP
jgi:eukaryotic-like serine/threonine-protein kinase